MTYKDTKIFVDAWCGKVTFKNPVALWIIRAGYITVWHDAAKSVQSAWEWSVVEHADSVQWFAERDSKISKGVNCLMLA